MGSQINRNMLDVQMPDLCIDCNSVCLFCFSLRQRRSDAPWRVADVKVGVYNYICVITARDEYTRLTIPYDSIQDVMTDVDIQSLFVMIFYLFKRYEFLR